MGKIFVVIAGLIFFLSIWFFFLKGEPTEKVIKEGPIIFFGNSITTGVGAGEGEDFPSLVTKQLNLKNVINAGVSGDTTETALSRLKTDVLDKEPSLVIVELSGNDFLGGIAAEETINNLDSITNQIRTTGTQVVLVHIRFPRKASEYEDGFKKIAEKYNVEVVWDALEGVVGNQSLMSDTIHPNTAGYKIMAERIAKALKEVL